MRKYKELPTNTVLQGDVIGVAKGLPDRSVNMIVTSPPYWGLRDYQTGEWVGGDEGCDHVKNYNLKQDSSGGVSVGPLGTRGMQPSSLSSVEQYPDTCAKCGATRKDDQIGMEATPDCELQGFVRLKKNLSKDQKRLVAQWLLDGGHLDAL